MKRITTAVALAMLGAGAGPVVAQQTPPPAARTPVAPVMPPRPAAPGAMRGMMGGMQGMGGLMGGMMEGMMAPQGAQDLLAMRQALGLTDAQVQQLRTIADQSAPAVRPHMEAAMQAHHAAMQAMEADPPDVARFQTELQAAANHFVEAQVARARSAVQALAVLTPEQRANVRFAMRLQHARMMQGMSGMGMSGMQGMRMPGARARPAPRPMPRMPHDTTSH